MPNNSMFDEETLLASIHAVAARSNISHEIYSPLDFSELVLANEQFDWDEVAARSGIQKQKARRWFRETYQRRLHGPVEKEDVQLLKNLIQKSFLTGQGIQNEKEFQHMVKSRLSKQYNQHSFVAAYNNTKRLVAQAVSDGKKSFR